MKKKSAVPYKSLRAKCKESLAKWQYREVFRICSTQNRPPNGDDLVKMASDLCDRLRSFRVEASEAEARQMIEKHLHGYVVRAEQELISRNKLIAPESAETDIEETERLRWAQSFPDPVGKGEALIKAYKRRFGLTRIQAVEELQALGYRFPQEVIDRQYRIVEEIQQQKAARKENRKQKRLKKTQQESRKDQDDRFFYIAGYTSGGAPYGITWEEMGLMPYQDSDEWAENETEDL